MSPLEDTPSGMARIWRIRMISLSVQMSEDLKSKIDEVAHATSQTQGDILRKAIVLYLAANEAVRQGKKVGLVDSQTNVLVTQIVGI